MKNLLLGVVAMSLAAAGAFVILSGSEEATSVGPITDSVVKTDPPAIAEKSEEEAARPVPSKDGPWGKAVAEDTSYTFGSMQVGTEKEHTFVIRNAGEADLKLQAGSPTCKCTAFKLSPETVKPGEEAQLFVKWKGVFKDDGFSHGGSVYTDDPKNPELKFTVQGIVDAALEIFPEGVWAIGGMSGNTEGAFKAHIASKIFPHFKITEVKCESPFIKSTISDMPSELLKEHKCLCGYVVEVEASADMPPGLLETKLSLTVDCMKEPVSVTVRANKPGPIRILPLAGVSFDEANVALKMGQFPASSGRDAELLLMVDLADIKEPLEFKSVTAVPPFVQVELKPFGESGTKARYKMAIRIPPGISRSARDSANPGRIDIQTNHPSGQSLNLKFSYKAF